MDPTLIAIAVGLIVSLVVTEVLGLSVGGMIVPGYIALSLHQPIAVVFTVLAAAMTWWIVRRISQHAIVFGRRRVVITILVGFAIGMTIRSIAAAVLVSGAPEAMTPMVMIGFIIPGLIALWFERQGFIETLSPMLSAAVMVRLCLILIGMETFS
ncbi:Capsule biosynthesis protein CapC [Novipirellula aureliae]|uniref:Capsule biosynthesis protein CapC n=1 Tax=Novipirellula aureliae TaxID=2527966 RepID=A0A5C6E7H9_9BACT|nr:poly-gamma-glutamate biosynthesis protein PgsC [Novipirellula aureliae]TWU43169.1 Capsule biosynthesis protein CapC [Novipirellula aureliae]